MITPKRHHVLPVIIVVAGMLLAGCSSAGGGGGTAAHGDSGAAKAAGSQQKQASDIDTCSLITQAEAATALGEPVEAGEKDADNPTACSWSSKKATPVEMIFVDLQPQFDNVYAHMTEPQITKVFVMTKISGIGDKAYTQSTKGDDGGSDVGDLLGVKKGDIALSFSIVRDSMSKDQGFAADKVLAKHALGRL